MRTLFVCLVVAMFFMGCSTREIVYVDKPLQTQCVKPMKPEIAPKPNIPMEIINKGQAFFNECTDEVYLFADILQKADIEPDLKQRLMDRIILACDKDVKALFSYILVSYATNLEKYSAYSQKWEVYGQCIEGVKNVQH